MVMTAVGVANGSCCNGGNRVFIGYGLVKVSYFGLVCRCVVIIVGKYSSKYYSIIRNKMGF